MPLPAEFERFASRAFVGLSCKVVMGFPNDTDTEAVRTAILGGAPLTILDFERDDININVTQGDDGLIVAEIPYLHPSIKDNSQRTPDDPVEVSFDTTGGTLHITQAKEIRDWSLNAKGFSSSAAKYFKFLKAPPGSSDPPVIADLPSDPEDWELKDKWKFDGAIGVTPDKDVEGTDVVIPKLAIVYRKLFLKSDVTSAYVKSLARMTGHTNNAAFKGFDAEELLFMGARGGPSGSYYAIEFIFEGSENLTGYLPTTSPDAEFQPPLEKKGHDHLWIFYERDALDDEKLVRPHPRLAFVDRNYDTINFADLGIGT